VQVPDVIPVAEAAAQFKVSRASLFALMSQGKLKRYRKPLDRRTFVDRQELKRLLRPRVVKA